MNYDFRKGQTVILTLPSGERSVESIFQRFELIGNFVQISPAHSDEFDTSTGISVRNTGSSLQPATPELEEEVRREVTQRLTDRKLKEEEDAVALAAQLSSELAVAYRWFDDLTDYEKARVQFLIEYCGGDLAEFPVGYA